jgi:hypothetical protein
MPPAARSLAKKTYLAIAILGLTGTMVLGVLPKPIGGAQPPLYLYLLAGLIGVVVTGCILSLTAEYQPNLKRRLLWLVFSYNAFIVLVKLLLVPFGLYSYNAGKSFTGTPLGDQNSVIYYVLSGAFVFLLYAVVWWLIYRTYAKRTAALLTSPQAATEWVGLNKDNRWRKTVLTMGIGILIAVGLFATGTWGILFLFSAGALDYLNLIVSSGIIVPVAASLAAAVLLAVGAFREAESAALEIKDATVLASLFWLGLALIAVYHVMWIIFMVALVTTWPFNTYTPK